MADTGHSHEKCNQGSREEGSQGELRLGCLQASETLNDKCQTPESDVLDSSTLEGSP